MERKKCFVYCRQSSGCSEAENSLSIQQQLTNCLETAKKMDLEVLDVFTDANVSGKTYPAGAAFEQIAAGDRGFQAWFDQQSGSKKFRAGLGGMMERIGEVDYVVLDEMTRLQRAAANSFLEQVLTFEFTRAGVKLIQVKGGALDLSSFDQNLIQLLKTRVNDEQIANQKRKSMESRRKLRDAGIFCNVKFFAGVYDGGKTFHFDRGRAEVVRFVFSEFLGGVTFSRIISQVNGLFPGRFGRARCFYASTLRHILGQPLYAGLMYNTERELIRCVNAPPSLISPAEFCEAQRLLTARSRHRCAPRAAGLRNEVLIFSGFLRCAGCGANLLVAYDRQRITYKCRNGDFGGPACCRSSRIFISGGGGEAWGLRSALRPLLAVAWLKRRKKLWGCRAALKRTDLLRDEEKYLRSKIRTAFDLFEADVMDERTYRESVSGAMEKLRLLRATLLELEQGEKRAEDIMKEIAECDRGLLLLQKTDELPDRLYRKLLSGCIDHIDVGAAELRIFSAAGIFVLPRIDRDGRQRRVCPPSMLVRNGEGERIGFDVIFDAGKGSCREKLLVSWENLKIILKEG